MSAVALAIFGLLIYPGLLTALLLSLVAGRVLGGPATGGHAVAGLVDAVTGRGPIASALAVLLALLALGRLPWPGLPWQERAALQPWALWGLVEASAAAAVLPAVMSQEVVASRTAVREAQLGLSGRLPIWIALGATLYVHGLAERASRWPADPGLLVAALAVLLALPAAAGWPPFGYAGLGQDRQPAVGVAAWDDQEAALARWARRLLSIFWLALAATVFVPLPPLPWWGELLMRLGLIVALASLARGSRGLFANRTLPAGLRWCWWVALPCALASLVLTR